jgi:hypothetical protein
MQLNLFANGLGDNAGLAIGAGVIAFIVIALYRGYLFFYRPDQYEAMLQREHQKKLARVEASKGKTGRLVGGILGGVARGVIAAAIKGRPHH